MDVLKLYFLNNFLNYYLCSMATCKSQSPIWGNRNINLRKSKPHYNMNIEESRKLHQRKLLALDQRF